MACYHPLKSFEIGFNALTGKKVMKVVPYSVHHLEKVGSEIIPSESETSSSLASKTFFKYYTIPCGQCIGCRLEYSRQWANRLMLELQFHDPGLCWFLTLTYDNDHAYDLEHCLVNSVDPDTGEYRENLSLNKRDVQLFHKRLRKRFGDGIRFYLAGEYGESTFRPHYHGIYFNLPLPFEKFELWSRTAQGFTLWHWPELDDIWSLGRVIIAPVSWDTCAYTARYVTKKLTGAEAEFYSNFNLVPEFSLMSRRPGIARQYFDLHPDCVENKIVISTDTGGLKFSAPRYFHDLWKVDHQLENEYRYLENKRLMDEKQRLVAEKNSLAKSDYLMYLSDMERKHEAAAQQLVRSDCDIFT